MHLPQFKPLAPNSLDNPGPPPHPRKCYTCNIPLWNTERNQARVPSAFRTAGATFVPSSSIACIIFACGKVAAVI